MRNFASTIRAVALLAPPWPAGRGGYDCACNVMAVLFSIIYIFCTLYSCANAVAAAAAFASALWPSLPLLLALRLCLLPLPLPSPLRFGRRCCRRFAAVALLLLLLLLLPLRDKHSRYACVAHAQRKARERERERERQQSSSRAAQQRCAVLACLPAEPPFRRVLLRCFLCLPRRRRLRSAA